VEEVDRGVALEIGGRRRSAQSIRPARGSRLFEVMDLVNLLINSESEKAA